MYSRLQRSLCRAFPCALIIYYNLSKRNFRSQVEKWRPIQNYVLTDLKEATELVVDVFVFHYCRCASLRYFSASLRRLLTRLINYNFSYIDKGRLSLDITLTKFGTTVAGLGWVCVTAKLFADSVIDMCTSKL